MTTLLARTWRGSTDAADADAYLTYLRATELAEYGATPGDRGVFDPALDGGARGGPRAAAALGAGARRTRARGGAGRGPRRGRPWWSRDRRLADARSGAHRRRVLLGPGLARRAGRRARPVRRAGHGDATGGRGRGSRARRTSAPARRSPCTCTTPPGGPLGQSPARPARGGRRSAARPPPCRRAAGRRRRAPRARSRGRACRRGSGSTTCGATRRGGAAGVRGPRCPAPGRAVVGRTVVATTATAAIAGRRPLRLTCRPSRDAGGRGCRTPGSTSGRRRSTARTSRVPPTPSGSRSRAVPTRPR